MTDVPTFSDFGNNWAEAIGRSSYYSLQTDKKPGIVLIMESMKDRKYIDTWNVGNGAY
jgi:hypothetical protein